MHPPFPTAATARPAPPIGFAIGPGLAAVAVAYPLTGDLGALGMTVQLDLGLADSALLISFAGCLLAIVVGLVAAILARRYPTAVTLSGTAAATIGAVLLGLAPTLAVYAIGKFLVGLGAGAIWTSALLLARATGRPGRAIAPILGAAMALSALIAPLAAGWITMTLAWHLALLAAVPVLLCCGALTAVLRAAVPVPPQPLGGGGLPTGPGTTVE